MWACIVFPCGYPKVVLLPKNTGLAERCCHFNGSFGKFSISNNHKHGLVSNDDPKLFGNHRAYYWMH